MSISNISRPTFQVQMDSSINHAATKLASDINREAQAQVEGLNLGSTSIVEAINKLDNLRHHLIDSMPAHDRTIINALIERHIQNIKERERG